MRDSSGIDALVPNVCVPLSMVARDRTFGGKRVQDCLHGDLQINGGVVTGLAPCSDMRGPAKMVLPKLTEAHVHLDKCHTISRVEGVGGNLQSAIDAQAMDRMHWTDDDVRARASRGLDELIAAGCGAVRTHVDWGAADDQTPPSSAWPVLCELAQDYRSQVTLQVVPLTGIDDLADLETARQIARQLATKTDVLGSFVYGQPDRKKGIRNAFHLAEKHGLALDFHVDEGLEQGLDGLDMIADAAIETGFEGPVLCGHACSLINLGASDMDRLAHKLARAGISVVSLPSANLYLQGRTQGTPDRRGVTRVHELKAAGVRVVVGTDNVRDAFCPLGRFDPRQSLAMAVLAAHLDPPFGQYLPMITTDAAQAIGLAPRHVDGAAIGDLIQFDAETTADLVGDVMPPTPLAAILKGSVG